MEIVKVGKEDTAIVSTIISTLIDSSDKKETVPDKDYLQKFIADDRTYLLASFIDDLIVGYTLAYRFPSLYAAEYLAYLYDIEVLPQYRRKGVGRKLVEAITEILKKDGVTELWLGTAVDNVEGQALFQATGAVKSGETFNDYTYYLA
ncbi:MAG TPA: GNAT family N-acetyltransferase [Chitinophagaceae bacterium]|nr:GNAT family N-acetyltransferase [Chitinophagaceae bacterium]